MKLLYCDVCHHVVAIRGSHWSKCDCGRIGGQYNEDGVTATVGGPARVFGVANPFFAPEWQQLTPGQQQDKREAYNYGPSDCWWGGYEGDSQLLFIKSPSGPRLSHRAVLRRVAKMQGLSPNKSRDAVDQSAQFSPSRLSEARRSMKKQLKNLAKNGQSVYW